MGNVIDLFERQFKGGGGAGDDGFVIALAWALAAQGQIPGNQLEALARDLLAQSNSAAERIDAFDRVLDHMRSILPEMLERARDRPV